MDYSTLPPQGISKLLEKTVLEGTPAQLEKLYKDIGEVKVSARALAMACRYRGLPYVKVLVENGANFNINIKLNYDTMEKFRIKTVEYSACILDTPFRISYGQGKINFAAMDSEAIQKNLSLLSFRERSRVLAYLLENKEKIGFKAEKVLYYSIFAKDKEMYNELKRQGVTFSDGLKSLLTEGVKNNENYEDWDHYTWLFSDLAGEDFFWVNECILSEIGEDKKLNYTESIYYYSRNIFYEPQIFAFFMAHFNQKKMSKGKIMKEIIDREQIELLNIVAENGWLKLPRKRDEMIEYASEKGKTEATAWLLDFKNRTANLAKEAKNREKRLMQALNADPNSLTELKKIWKFKLVDKDGENEADKDKIIITNYLGKDTKVTVPEKLGKYTIVGIGAYAFSPGGYRLKGEQMAFRGTITEVKLPDSVQSIAKGAFCGCKALTEVNIPDGVDEIADSVFEGCEQIAHLDVPDSVMNIGKNAFAACSKLEEIHIPYGVKMIGDSAFSGCVKLAEVKLPDTVGKIGLGAFADCNSFERFTVPEGVRVIGYVAFSKCQNLKIVELPNSLRDMKNIMAYQENKPRTAFWGMKNYTVIVPEKSYAEKYCKKHDIPFKYKENKEEKQ